MSHILLVEDDEDICEIIQFYLTEREDYQIMTVHSAEAALSLADKRKFDLVLLDIMLKGMNGIDFCREFRRKSYCPVIFISCLNDDETMIRALNEGGDDYLTKPFQASVLMARIDANLRRWKMMQKREDSQHLKIGKLILDETTRNVRKEEEMLELSPTEYEILHFLMKNKERFVSFDEIYQEVWHRDSLGDVRALFVHISHLRQKIEDNPSKPQYIRTHMRGGYILSVPEILK